ncbi:hypothetical protein PpSQ1_26970, partial [Pseudomonas putida]
SFHFKTFVHFFVTFLQYLLNIFDSYSDDWQNYNKNENQNGSCKSFDKHPKNCGRSFRRKAKFGKDINLN